MYVSPAQNGYQAIVIKPGKSLLEISMSGSTQWRTLATTAVTSEATRGQWYTSGAVGDKTHLGVPDLQTPPQRWVVATTAPVAGSTVRFVSMATGHCGEFKWSGTADYLFNATCQMGCRLRRSGWCLMVEMSSGSALPFTVGLAPRRASPAG